MCPDVQPDEDVSAQTVKAAKLLDTHLQGFPKQCILFHWIESINMFSLFAHEYYILSLTWCVNCFISQGTNIWEPGPWIYSCCSHERTAGSSSTFNIRKNKMEAFRDGAEHSTRRTFYFTWPLSKSITGPQVLVQHRLMLRSPVFPSIKVNWNNGTYGPPPERCFLWEPLSLTFPTHLGSSTGHCKQSQLKEKTM